MPLNIVIFADGTGRCGGVQDDQRRSNIYKLYRAARVPPDKCIKPVEQAAFYRAGLGTLSGGIDAAAAFPRSLCNLVS